MCIALSLIIHELVTAGVFQVKLFLDSNVVKVQDRSQLGNPWAMCLGYYPYVPIFYDYSNADFEPRH